MPLLLFTCVFTKTDATFNECERTAVQILSTLIRKNDLLDKNQLKIKGGSHNPHNSPAVSISNIQIHPRYNNYNAGTHLQHDIALLTLAKAIEIGNEKVEYISLPPPGKKLCTGEEDLAWIAGWGYTKRNYEADLTRVTPPVILQVARVELISRRACQSIYPKFNFTEHIICTDSTNTDVCQGDSGGALFEEYLVLNRTTGLTTKKHRILGIVSGSSKGCGTASQASIFTGVAGYVESMISPALTKCLTKC
ncbi:hypothetical protein BV898_15457 [Hypsibius exemplaris]|uniref:Peptidase S1 domain-containing protein n=1 Tax=Hypsibius exemplaris TaxID=2072580 RepID=A0A9X6NDZ9_HYPEX|nr:hypothetical protein BV898_15457 [Hypsibius exemplaris]